MRIYKIKRESWNAETLLQTRLSQKPSRGTHPSELNLAQACNGLDLLFLLSMLVMANMSD